MGLKNQSSHAESISRRRPDPTEISQKYKENTAGRSMNRISIYRMERGGGYYSKIVLLLFGARTLLYTVFSVRTLVAVKTKDWEERV